MLGTWRRHPTDVNFRAPGHGQVLKLNIPIIAFTAEYDQEMKDKCTACGIDDFLFKPADAKEFKAKITKYLDSCTDRTCDIIVP